jgi:hypothetical protein
LLATLIGAGVFLRNIREKIYFVLNKIKGVFTKRTSVDKKNND